MQQLLCIGCSRLRQRLQWERRVWKTSKWLKALVWIAVKLKCSAGLTHVSFRKRSSSFTHLHVGVVWLLRRLEVMNSESVGRDFIPMARIENSRGRAVVSVPISKSEGYKVQLFATIQGGIASNYSLFIWILDFMFVSNQAVVQRLWDNQETASLKLSTCFDKKM